MQNSKQHLPWSVSSYYRSHLGAVLLVLGSAVVIAILSAAEPLLIKYLFDSFQVSKQFSLLAVCVVSLILVISIRELCVIFSKRLTARTRLRFQQELLRDAVKNLQILPRTHALEGVGGVATKLDRNVQNLGIALSEMLSIALPSAVYLIFALLIMMKLNWILALVVLFLAPLPGLIGVWSSSEAAHRDRVLMDQWVHIYSRFNQVLTGMNAVRTLGMVQKEKEIFLNGVASTNLVVEKGVARDSTVAGIQNLTSAFARLFILGLGGMWVLHSEISLGTLVAFISYMGSIFAPVQGVAGLYRNFRKAGTAVRSLSTLSMPHKNLPDVSNPVTLGQVRGDIKMVDIELCYEPNHPVLRNIDLQIHAGETVAIVGASGSGKTSLVSLLLRLNEPSRGSITIDGIDLRNIDETSLRQHVGVVLQDPWLINDTIAKNIQYGGADKSFEEVVHAAEIANAHQFISKFPNGYETQVGERGSFLSAGERQRIAIARAVLRKPAIVILDEATSSLDSESETLVQEALARLFKNHTSLVIAHRLSTIALADRIVVLKEGRVVESGTHAELVARAGYYATLVAHQANGLIAPMAA